VTSPLARIITRLRRELEPEELSLDASIRQAHAGDKWFAQASPDAVALPRSATAAATVLRFAHRHRIPVTPRGAGQGYVGGCVPSLGGIVLSLAHLDRVKEISRDDFVAVVEPGVITGDLQAAVEAQGLFYPPDPASRSECTLGGNIATNAGGPRCLKYGVTRDYVLGLQVATADGRLLRLGGRTHKNKTGFELARLFVGSEGMLGVVTEATLRLLPLPPDRACLSIGFASVAAATRTIRALFRAGILPAALEIADAFTLAAAARRTGSSLLDGCQAHLIIELDGQPAAVRAEARSVAAIARQFRPRFVRRGHGAAACEKIWALRREFSYALRDTGLTKLNEDIAVPRGRLDELFVFARHLQRKHELPIACFGHAGDGNIHVNVMVDSTAPNSKEQSQRVLDELFVQVLAWGGAITGEHGVGLAKRRWWPQAASREVRQLHRQIKDVLDPRGILNPGKFLPAPASRRRNQGPSRQHNSTPKTTRTRASLQTQGIA
jgi:glycolate oxidase subunit GlcD